MLLYWDKKTLEHSRALLLLHLFVKLFKCRHILNLEHWCELEPSVRLPNPMLTVGSKELIVCVVWKSLYTAVILRILLTNAGHFDRTRCLKVQVTRELFDVKHAIDQMFLKIQVVLLLQQDSLLNFLSLFYQVCVHLAQTKQLCVDFLLQEPSLLLIDIVVGADGCKTWVNHPIEIINSLLWIKILLRH